MDVSALSVRELQDRLLAAWVRYEKAMRDEMAPLLSELKKKLKAQGSRNGMGWSAWIKEGLGISLRTADRWVKEYDDSKNPSPQRNQPTSGQMARSLRKTSPPVDGMAPLPFQLVLTAEQRKQFNEAWEILEADHLGTEVVFDAVVSAASRTKKGARRVSIPTKKVQRVTVQ